MRGLNAFWQLNQLNEANVALIDPVIGQISYSEFMVEIGSFETQLSRHAKALSTSRLLIAIELCARSPIVAAYIAALRLGHVVLIGAPGSFAQGTPLVETYAPNLIITMVEDHCAVLPASSHLVDLHPDLRLLLSTSGSTGDPKLVRLSAENLSSNATAIAQYLGLLPDDRAVTTLPMHYIFGLSVLHAHLHVGATLVLTEMSVIDPEFAAFFEVTRGTSISVVPHQIDLLLANGFRADSLHGLRHIAQAGGKLAPAKVREMAAFAREAGWSFFVMYGQTEASPRMAYLPPDAAEAHSDSVGQAIPGGSFTLRDGTGAPITAPGLAGELIYSGPNVMMGYARSRSDLTLAKDTFELGTGDVAEFTREGFVKIVGRSARFTKLFGLRISLDQVEVLLRDAGFDGYAVAADDQLVLLLTDPNALEAARELVAKAYKLPLNSIQATHLVEVPVLPSGKVDLKHLELLARRAQKAVVSRPATAKSLRQVMAEATRRETVQPDETYTTLGGDSLGYLQVQIYLTEYLGAAPRGWENMTVRQIEALDPDAAKLVAFWSSVDIDVVLRVAALICIVLVHLARVPVGGGTWLLLMIMGYSFSRFQRPRLMEGRYLDVMLRMLHPILLLYAVLLLAYHLFQADVSWRYALLLGNSVAPGRGNFLTIFWFVSLYAQLVVLMVVVFMVAPFRRAQTQRPWQVWGLAFVLTTLCAIAVLGWSPDPFPKDRYLGIPGSPVAARSLIVALPIVILGIMMYFVKSRLQSILTIAGLVVTCLIFPETSPSQPYILGLGGLLLLSRISVPLPAFLARIITVMAASTLFVYLLHNIVVHVVRTATPTLEIIGVPAAAMLVVPMSFIIGHLAKVAFGVLDTKVSRWWRMSGALILREG
jgi:AMP-binding enzyme